MTEPHLSEALSALVDGELSAGEEDEARAHLGRCPTCAAELEAVRASRDLLRSLPPVEPPASFYVRLAEREPRSASVQRRGLLVLVGSAAASLIMVAAMAPREAPVSPPVGRLVEAHAATASADSDPVTDLGPAVVPVTFRP